MKPRLVVLLVLLPFLAAQAAALVPTTCSGACTTGARSPAFLAPVASISTGSSMTWISQDTVHDVADGATAATCFDVAVPANGASAAVTFVIDGDGLHAQRADAGGHVVDRLCTDAQALPDGGFAIAYRCLIHPEMRGTLVVEP